MQFGKVFINSDLDFTESEFVSKFKGFDLGGIDIKDAYKKFIESKPKKVTTKKIVENKEALD